MEYIDDEGKEETTEKTFLPIKTKYIPHQIKDAKKKIDRILNSQNDSADASTSTASSSSQSNLEFTLVNDSNEHNVQVYRKF